MLDTSDRRQGVSTTGICRDITSDVPGLFLMIGFVSGGDMLRGTTLMNIISSVQDLEPLWGIDPADLLKIQAKQEIKTDSFTLAKNGTGFGTVLDTVVFSDPETWQQRVLPHGVDGILDLLEPIK